MVPILPPNLTGYISMNKFDIVCRGDLQAFLFSDCSGSQDSSHTLVDEDTVLTYNPDGLPK